MTTTIYFEFEQAYPIISSLSQYQLNMLLSEKYISVRDDYVFSDISEIVNAVTRTNWTNKQFKRFIEDFNIKTTN